MGLTFPSSVVSALHETYGGHPFFTRQVCSKIHQIASLNRPIEVSLQLLGEAESAFGNQLEDYLTDIVGRLEQFYPDEFNLLTGLVCGEDGDLQYFAAEAPELVDHLLGYGLITQRHDAFEVTFSAIAEAVRKLQQLRNPAPRSAQEKWAEMVVRRNALEQAIRAAIYVQARVMDKDDWEKVLDEGLSKVRRNQIPSTLPSVLFSRENSPLYLTDLMGLIGEPAIMAYLDDKRTVISHLNTVNRLRNDAHAKDISDGKFKELTHAFDALEQEFLLV